MTRLRRLLASMTAAGVACIVSAAPGVAAAQPQAADAASEMGVSALSFSAKSVDATSGSATIGLNWTMTSSNPKASGFGGDIHVR